MSTRHQIPKPSNRTFILRFILFGFLSLTTLHVFCQVAEPTQLEQYISNLLAKIESDDRIVGELTLESLQNLPIGVKKTIGNNRIVIGIDSVSP